MHCLFLLSHPTVVIDDTHCKYCKNIAFKYYITHLVSFVKTLNECYLISHYAVIFVYLRTVTTNKN